MKDDRKAALEAKIATAKESETADHQHEWEAAVLSTLVKHINGDQSELKWRILNDLDADDFQRSDHRAIFQAMKALHEREEGVDWTTVCEYLKREGPAGLEDDVGRIFNAPIADQKTVETYVKRIADRGRFRCFRSCLASVQAEVDRAEQEGRGPAAVEEGVAKIQSAALDLSQKTRLVSSPKTEAECLPGFMLDLETKQSDQGFVGLDTGFRHLNQVLNGLQTGLLVIAGPPGVGKTTFVKQLADQIAETAKIPVLFFSFEQSADELRIKTLARLAKVNSRDILKGRVDMTVEDPLTRATRPAWDLIVEAATKYQDFGRHVRIIEADRETTVARIRLLAQAAKHQTRASRALIVVDYLQVVAVQDPKDFASTKDRVDWICSELRRVARDLDGPVVAISSENREAYKEGKRPTLAVFKESGGIEYTADVGAAFWPDREATERLGDSSRRVVRLIVLKNRFGENASIEFDFQAAIATFVDRDKEDMAYEDGFVEK